MPILDMQGDLRPQLLGTIRLGYAPKSKNNPKNYPVATDFFVVPDEVAEALGDPQPRKLNVFFLSESLDFTFATFHERYGQGGLRCRGDGHTVWKRVIYQTVKEEGKPQLKRRFVVSAGAITDKEYDPLKDSPEYGTDKRVANTLACPGLKCPLSIERMCRPTGRLKFAIREIPRFGYWLLWTHKYAIQGILGQLLMVKDYFGHIMDIPWILRLEEAAVDTEDGRRTFYNPIIEIEPSWLAREMTRRNLHLLAVREQARDDILALWGPDAEEEEESAPDYEPIVDAPYEVVHKEPTGQIPEGVVETGWHVPPEPKDKEARPGPRRKKAANAKTPVISGVDWQEALTAIVAATGDFYRSDGEVDNMRVLHAVAQQAGLKKIDAASLEEAKQAAIQYARDQEALAAQAQPELPF